MKLAAVLLLCGVTALVVWLVIADQTLKSGFARIAPGESAAQVEEILGPPHAVEACNSNGGTPARACAREYSYMSLLSFTDVWTVTFDRSGRVLRTLRYRSP